MDISRMPRCYDPFSLTMLSLAGVAGFGASKIMQANDPARNAAKNAAQAREQAATPPAANPATTVGDKTGNMTSAANNLGRAALISTSPTGVLGTDPTGRKRLLGN